MNKMNKMTSDKKNAIVIAEDFSKYTGYRYKSQSAGSSGEEFREEFLLPGIKEHTFIKVDLNGVQNRILPSFLEEAFAGLARSKKWDLETFKKHIEIVSDRSDYIDDIYFYIKNTQK
jgi:hypothetical protein